MFSFFTNLISTTNKDENDILRKNEDIYNIELKKYIADLTNGLITSYYQDYQRCRILDELYEKAYKSKHEHEPSLDYFDEEPVNIPQENGAYTEDGEKLEEDNSNELLIKFRNKVLNKLYLVSQNNDFLNDFTQFVYEKERSTGADIFCDDYDVLPEFNEYIR